MWAPGNSTKIIMTYAVEWSGKSWIKGPIEKGAADGQLTYAQALVAALKAAVTKSATPKTKGGKTRQRRKREGETISAEPHPTLASSNQTRSNWSIDRVLGEPAYITIVVLSLVVIILFFRGRKNSSHGLGHLERRIIYEDMWKTEENELWDWIEERAGIQHIREVDKPSGYVAAKKKTIDTLSNLEGMAEREVMEAIRVTKERLNRLENAVKGKKEDSEKLEL